VPLIDTGSSGSLAGCRKKSRKNRGQHSRAA
jgi:hypothetical protein